ncbi:TonB-dependent receptor [Parasegetibacter sp. NRK P23]|uniref:SusC/RagA family TonB-linked outer membrane protein n=1 Tax=Parasegetibacter sp. NRK P23 TaxID=2942999 RepID=UPI002042FED0|nr:TonB-dependent receptor [Parasegetibacter sp. NRK P23]MCM5529205.1 TonB-dependent receptor [Parasegetibacter sp. NRK P23]
MIRRFACCMWRITAHSSRSFHFLFSLTFIAMLFMAGDVVAQTPSRITITGTVKDTSGRVLEGASVVTNTKNALSTATDRNGKFVLEVPVGTEFRVSFVGFLEQSFEATALRREFTIVLHESSAAGEEIVVTAFGKKQRREAVVGSVSSVNPDDLKIPASNLTNALAGQVAGVIAFQRIGQPGADNSQFFIRGVTTLGYSASPLILVDNIELTANDLARLQVDDIASFSILKDASAAALYGARGANGVILVTTKEGKSGKAKINFRIENSSSRPTKNLELADPITFMNAFNEAVTTRDPLATPFFTPNEIINTRATLNKEPGHNPYVYPAVDWMDVLFKDKTTTRRANFSVSGGTDVTKYYFAGSYSRDNGIMEVNPVNNFNTGMKFENYQLRSNINVKVTKTTEAVVRLWGNFNDYTGPITSHESGIATDLYNQALHTSPVAFPAFYLPDSATMLNKHILFGNSLRSGNLLRNPYASLMYGYKNFSESRISAQFELNQDFNFITKGLSFRGIFSTNRYSYFDISRNYLPFYYSWNTYDPASNEYTLRWLNDQPGQAQEFLGYNEGQKNIFSYVYLQGALDYNRDFGMHNLSGALIGTRQQTLYGNAGSLLNSLPFRNLGLSGRVSYSYDSRYFVEGNFGYNGSERFAPDNRWGFFPTIGAGWVISNEKFWGGKIADYITRLKLRGSYGLVGNDNIGSQRFFYLSSVRPRGGPQAWFGTNNSVTMNGTAIDAYPNPDVTWETGRKSNLALELTIAKNLNITAEIYKEHRYNILIPRGYIPVTVGIETSAANSLQANLGEMDSKGLDLNLNYKKTFSKNLWASVMGNLTVTSSKIVSFEEPEYNYDYRFITGRPGAQPFGYIAERLFVDDKEALNAPTQLFGDGFRPMGGDIKYRDINEDGVINQDDQVPIGLPTTPEIIYGFGFSLGYKNFDLNAFFQGLARESFFIDAQNTAPFVNNAQLLKAYAENHWSEENQNLYALWPRLSPNHIANNTQRSTWWMRDGSFMRLKSVEAGYTLPKRWSGTLHAENIRIYFSGLNLLTFSKFKMWDPEQAGDGFAYPIQKVVNLGVNINF